MRKKHEHSTRAGKTPRLSEKALLNLGHHHHANEEYLVRLAQEEGDPYLVAPYAERLSELLADTAVRAMAGDPALLPHMWQNGFAVNQRRKYSLRNVDQSEKDVPDRPSGTRTLSKKARKAISKAQKERWARYNAKKAAERERWRESSQARRDRAGTKQKPATYHKNRASGMKGYWANMTEEERSREMVRRHKVTAEKKKASAA